MRAEVTGSVAINTAPKAKPPSTRCIYQGILATAVSGPNWLNKNAVNAPPTNTDNIVFQLATRVTRRITAPIRIANVETSPTEPGMKPRNASINETGSVYSEATAT